MALKIELNSSDNKSIDFLEFVLDITTEMMMMLVREEDLDIQDFLSMICKELVIGWSLKVLPSAKSLKMAS